MSRDLSGRVAIVTAAAQGIGEASARIMAAHGAAVVVADINEPGAKKVAESIVADGGRSSAVRMDARDEASIREMIEGAYKSYGRLDILHNNAGGTDPLKDSQAVEMTNDVWRDVFAYNMDSVHWGCKYAIPFMISGGAGAIVNTVTGGAYLGMSNQIAYGTSKGGVASYTRYIAVQYGHKNIRCNGIAPGLILTPNAQAVLSEPIIKALSKHKTTTRLGKPEDIGELAAFLASDAAAYINGQVIRVDGGAGIRSSHDADLREIMGL
jgi:NAD(P)-dependent dehydrogenase (short-subunit alcohol dehydrogenase family)